MTHQWQHPADASRCWHFGYSRSL